MKKLLAVAALFAASTAMAGFNDGKNQQGGFNGGNAGVIATVEQAKKGYDDQYVALRGNITEQIGKEHYTFKDKTGSIVVEIDDDKWYGLTVNPSDTVTIYGEIDKEWHGTKIDVKRITK